MTVRLVATREGDRIFSNYGRFQKFTYSHLEGVSFRGIACRETSLASITYIRKVINFRLSFYRIFVFFC